MAEHGLAQLALLAGALLTGLALGLWWGERLGLRAGQRLGQVAAPLELRRASLEQGRCVLCGRDPASGRQATGGPDLSVPPVSETALTGRSVGGLGED